MKKKSRVLSKRSYKQKKLLPSSAEGDREAQKRNGLFGFMAGEFGILGDIESRLADWEYRDRANKLKG